MLALWEGVGRHHLHTWGPRPLVPQVAAGFPREAKVWAPRLCRVCPGHSPCAPGSPEEPWGFKPPLPTRFSAPSPSPFGLRRSRPAQTCLLLSPAGRQGADPFQGTGEGWGMLRPAGRPRVLHSDPPRLSPAWVLPTPSGGSFLWSFPRHSFLCQGGSRLLGLELQQ